MLEAFYAIKVGVIAGVVMGMSAMILNMIKFTTLDLTKYSGALLTGQAAGRVNFIAGFCLHIIASGFFGVVYAYLIAHFNIVIALHNAMYFGLIHALISGYILSVFDKMNPCVAQGSIKRMGYFASNYGMTAVLTFFGLHVIYAEAVFFMLAR